MGATVYFTHIFSQSSSAHKNNNNNNNMEEGSLLQEALNWTSSCSAANKYHDGSDVNNDESQSQSHQHQHQQQQQHGSALVVDLYKLSHVLPPCNNNKNQQQQQQQQQQHLLQLAETAVALNTALQNDCVYPWISGGDGPVFGVHLTTTTTASAVVPHLRAVVRYYGVSVDDEWELVRRLLNITGSNSNNNNNSINNNEDWALECWDVDDGQLLLIEAAEHLPDWVDQIGPEHCRHRCWIRRGEVLLIRPTEQELEAFLLKRRRRRNHNGASTTAPTSLQPLSLSLSLAEALTLLARQHRHEVDRDPQQTSPQPQVQVAPPAVQRALRHRMARIDHDRLLFHRAAVAVPRPVARLLHQRPDLIATACRLFVEQTNLPNNSNNNTFINTLLSPEDDRHNDWVWTTIRCGRTPYAMLRTVTARNNWTSELAIPAPYAQCLAVKRLQRQCAAEATPHLRHGLALGVRLTAGLVYGATTTTTTSTTSTTTTTTTTATNHPMTPWPARLEHWRKLATAAAGVVDNDDDWLLRAWQAGPHAATHNLTHVLQCPVADPELTSSSTAAGTPLSHPDTPLSQQIRQGLRQRYRGAGGDDDDDDDDDDEDNDGLWCLVPPRADEVDSEDWLWIPSEDAELLRQTSTGVPEPSPPHPHESQTHSDPPAVTTNDTTTSALGDMLTGVQSFMAGQSSLEGVATVDGTGNSRSTSITTPVINPTVFLNILHATLQSATADELMARLTPATTTAAAVTVDSGHIDDPFFSQEDYDLVMDPALQEDDDDSDSSVSASDDKVKSSAGMDHLMRAMDEELLQHKNVSRRLDGDDSHTNSNGNNNTNSTGDDDSMAQDVHILSNLLKSLDAGAGGPGPVTNILGEMGIRVPDVRPTLESHDDEE